MASKSTVTDWIISTAHHTRHRPTPTFASTVTHIDYVTSTIYASPTAEATSLSDQDDVWEHRIHRFLPVLLAFAIIGILTVLGSLVYLMYRLYQARRRRPNTETQFDNEKPNSPISATLSHIIPWLSIPSPRHPTDTDNYSNYQPKQREPIRYERSDLHKIMNDDASQQRRPSLAPSWLAKLWTKKPKRSASLPIIFNNERPSTIDNLNVPISSTFVPIDTSSLTLVPRSEIWLDPTRRRGVDELDMWERKNSGTQTIVATTSTPPLLWRFPSNQEAYPDSPESISRRFSEPERRFSPKSSTTTMQELVPNRSQSETMHQEPSSSKDGPVGITVKLPKPKQSDVLVARQELEHSRLQNSSSQWLYPSGSKSL